MGLKQSVVVVNEFTTKTANGGTRGGTPGDYVLRYMARDGATEDLTPVRKDTENFIMRYMARKEAVDVARSVPELKEDMRDIQGDGGIAFGYGEVSLSHKKLKKASKDIQKNFDNGKTVLKTVLSFDESYLRQYGIIQPDFEFENEGDYRGNIDQLKLRMAIMNGMEKLSRHYDDLQYIGVIQVDTKHVHCHLAMVDRGVGTIMPDGTQRGKLTDKEKQDIRRGIDSYLDESQSVKMMAANVDYDKRNTLCYIKKFTHKAMDNRGFGQFLLACLPEDRNLWRAGSNRKEMRKPNAIVREYVTELLKQPDSGYNEAMQKVGMYAQSRMKREDLTGREYRKLVSEGRNRIIEEGMNCVYSVLKQVPDEEMNLRTPMLEIMAAPYEDIANEAEDDPIIEFGFKLRSYKTRLDHHKKERHKYHDAVEDYKQREARGETSEASKPLFDYLKEEEEYNAKLMAKYQHFLNFIPPTEEYQQGFDELMEYDERIMNLSRMRRDSSMTRMKSDNAERYGRKVYGIEGGSYMVTMPQVLDNRLDAMRTRYDEMRDAYKIKLADYGMVLGDDNEIKKELPYEFDDVKALDIHHLMYDFPYDFRISTRNVDQFVRAADARYEKFQKAKAYLVGSGQEETLESFPVADIELQKSTADRFREDTTFHTQRSLTPEERKATRTVTLDYDFYVRQEEEIKNIIKETINDLQYE
jgi:hypothetical protein